MFKFLLSLFKFRDQEDLWWIGDSWEGEFPIVIRARCKIPKAQTSGEYIYRIEIHWDFESDGSGMPSKNEKSLMNDFENLLEIALEKPLLAIQVVCRTGNNHRDWFYYTRDVEKFMEVFNKMLSGRQPYPIAINFEEDRDWEYFRAVLKGAKDRS